MNIKSNRYNNTNRKSRSCKTRNNKLILSLLLSSIVIISVLSFSSIFTNASSIDDTNNLRKCYYEITVEPNDTLWDIACKYCSDIEDVNTYLKNIIISNNLSSTTIHAGNTLVVYYYAEVVPQ